MSVMLKNGAQGFVARYEGLRAQLPGDAAIRAGAAESFRAMGLPGVRDEAWKYTNLRPVAEASFHEPMVAVSDRPMAGQQALLGLLPQLDVPRLVFIDGRFQADASVLPEKIQFQRFADHPQFSDIVHPEREPLVALNTMLAEDGAQINVPAGVDGGILMLASLGGNLPGHPAAFHMRHSIRLERGARLTLIEVSTGQGDYLNNPVSDIIVAEGAVLTHVRLQDESHHAFHLSTVYADVAGTGTYDSFLLTLGARLARAEVHTRLLGENATVHLNGAQLLGGAQHADFTTVVRHDAPSCASRQTVKNVLTGRARGVFQGKIEVARCAQKTDGYQMNQALLLSPEAEIDSKPQLEIYADDVKCSHGATVGELDAEQLFYLRSRGVPHEQARAILVRAFLSEALDPIADDVLRGVLETAIETWWTRQAA